MVESSGWQTVVHWRREWQTTLAVTLFLRTPWTVGKGKSKLNKGNKREKILVPPFVFRRLCLCRLLLGNINSESVFQNDTEQADILACLFWILFLLPLHQHGRPAGFLLLPSAFLFQPSCTDCPYSQDFCCCFQSTTYIFGCYLPPDFMSIFLTALVNDFPCRSCSHIQLSMSRSRLTNSSSIPPATLAAFLIS